MATHSRILAWRIPRAEESVGVQSIRSQSWTRLNLVWRTHKSICQGLTATTTNGISYPPLWRLNPVLPQLLTFSTPEGDQGGMRYSEPQGIWWDRSLDRYFQELIS